MKRANCIVLVFLLVLSMTGCFYKQYYGNRPVDQPNTTWVAPEHNITIYMEDDVVGHGTMQVGEETIQFLFSNGISVEIELLRMDALDDNAVYPEERFEYWTGDFKHDDHFTATVIESTYFSPGDQIIFYRLDEKS